MEMGNRGSVKHKTTHMMIAAVLILSLIGTDVFANESDFKWDDNQDGTATITGYTGTNKDIVIPQILGGLKVTTIADGAFRAKQLTSATIPMGVQSIGEDAFAKNQLSKLTISEGVESIGKGAFWENWLTEVIIPGSVKSIGSFAFYNNGINSVNIGYGVEEIGEWAFYQNKLETITLPASLRSIGKYAVEFTSGNDPRSVYVLGETVDFFDDGSANGSFIRNQKANSDITLYGYPGSNTELYAVELNYTFIPIYRVIYNGNGSEKGAVPGFPIDKNHVYEDGDNVTVLGNIGNLVKRGYTVDGWNTVADGSGTPYAVGATFNMGSTDVVLYAQWTQSAPTKPHPSTGSPSALDGDTGADVIVNGRTVRAGKVTTTEINGQRVTTVAVDEERLQKSLAAEGRGATITIPFTADSDVVSGELNGRMVKDMETQQAVLEIRSAQATYTLPAAQINIDALSDQFGTDVQLVDIKVNIEIARPPASAVQVVENAANGGGFTLVVPPVNFRVTATHGDRTQEVTQFNAYVERTVAIPEGTDPNRITTAIVVEPDGTVRHVPTEVIVIGGKYYARIHSLTNSTYTVIWNPVEFSDVASHWARDAVNNMGSRMVVNGTSDGFYSPDRHITRAEFAAIIVRSLGLGFGPQEGQGVFADVAGSDWFNGAVNTAYEYQLLQGYGDGTFRPHEPITREQSMVIMANAMKITGLKQQLPADASEAVLHRYRDAAELAAWSLAAVADNIQAGVVSGRGDSELAPKAFITRAEVAAMAERLLRVSGLIQ